MSDTATIKLRQPVQFGKDDLVEELVLKPTARFYKDTPITSGPNGLTYSPYDFAVIGVKLAGRPAASAFVDKMHPADMMEVANAVLVFLSPDQTTGNGPSQ